MSSVLTKEYSFVCSSSRRIFGYWVLIFISPLFQTILDVCVCACACVRVQTACYQLEPPHYDGVQSLFEHDGQLYSGSRDHSIKQWDLASRQLRQVSVWLGLLLLLLLLYHYIGFYLFIFILFQAIHGWGSQ